MKYKSEVAQIVHEMASDLYQIDAISRGRMAD